jgi:hypothetical protein
LVLFEPSLRVLGHAAGGWRSALLGANLACEIAPSRSRKFPFSSILPALLSPQSSPNDPDRTPAWCSTPYFCAAMQAAVIDIGHRRRFCLLLAVCGV